MVLSKEVQWEKPTLTPICAPLLLVSRAELGGRGQTASPHIQLPEGAGAQNTSGLWPAVT